MSHDSDNSLSSRSAARPTWKPRVILLAAIATVLLFGWFVSGFYDRTTGLTSMISIGDRTEAVAIPKLREISHYTYRHSYGYDGAYYVQIALSPLLNDPQLGTAIDNLPYRARRILLSWTAWFLGAGQPGWIIHVFPLLNVATWLALAWLLRRWFPLTSWDSFFRWGTFMFSHGMCMSVRHSLVDAPSLLLIVMAVLALERRRHLNAALVLSLATLTRETSVLATVAFSGDDPRNPRTWLKRAALLAVVAAPLAAWLFYLRAKFGTSSGAGFNNFAPPFVGLAEKWVESIVALFQEVVWPLDWATAACVLSLTVQCIFLLARWRPSETWWRIGAMFALMAVFLSRPVWEGFPGAATRVLLPMSLAFNILVPRGRRWLPILVAGNLTVFASVSEFNPPPRFFNIAAPSAMAAAVTISDTGHWYQVESRGSNTWRWASGDAGLVFENTSDQPLAATLHGTVSVLDRNREIAVRFGEQRLWSTTLSSDRAGFSLAFTLPPGSSELHFITPQPAPPEDRDGRALAFSVSNLKLTLRPAPPSAP